MKLSTRLRRFFLRSSAAMLAATALLAQTDLSTIRGTVTDSSGAVISGVDVTATDTTTNIKRAVVTDGEGNFEIPYLKRGTYRLTASKTGFRAFAADNLILESTQVRRIDAVLEIGATTSEVTVRADASVIEPETSKVSAGFGQNRYLQTPLTLSHLAVWYVLTTLPNIQSPAGGLGYRVAGQPGSQAEFAVDGVPNGGRGVVITTSLSIEDMQELKLTSINNSAEFSRIGSYNMVTRSGTNDWHGRLFYLHQNEFFDARPTFASQKVRFKGHTYGANIGGPLNLPKLYSGRDRTFFYVGYSGQRLPQQSFFVNDVPTSAMRTGDFSQLLRVASPVAVRDPLTGDPFPNNVIPSARLNPTSRQFQDKYMPSANFGGPDQLATNFRWIHPYAIDLNAAEIITGRIDHKLSNDNSLAGKISFARWPYNLAGNWPAAFWTRLRHQYAVMLSDTHVFGSAVVNEFRFGFHREFWNDGAAYRGKDVLSELALQGIPNPPEGFGFPVMNISGYRPFQIGGTGGDWIYRPATFADSLTWAHGRHIFKVGGEHRQYFNFNGGIPAGSYGSFAFDGTYTRNAYADFMLGLPRSSTRLQPLLRRSRHGSESGLFAQDTFKVNSRLTVEYGIRWEVFPPTSFDDGGQYNWDPVTGDVIVPQESLSQVSPLFPSTIKVRAGQVLYNSDKSNFTPRVGFAYRPFKDTVIRGAYGLFNEYLGYDAYAYTGGPFQLSETFFNEIRSTGPLFQFPTPFPTGATGTIPSQSVSGYPADAKNGYVQQFNFTIERQIRDVGVRVSYIGSRSHGLNYPVNINKPPASQIPFTTNRRPYPQLVGATYTFLGGNAKYDALQIQAQRKLATNLMFDVHWTLSNNVSDTLNLENPYKQRYYNRDQYTPKHRLVMNAAWQLPFGKGRTWNLSRVPDLAFGGWTVNILGYFQTGQFFTPSFSGTDPSNTNTIGGLPDRIADGNLPTSQRKITGWFDASAFRVPQTGTFGNSGVNILQGPGLSTLSTSLVKRFQLGERLAADLTAAASNVLNHPNYAFPASNISVPGQAGTISALYGAYQGGAERAGYRQLELRLRLEF